MSTSKYEVVYIVSIKRWAVRDNDKRELNQYVFWSNEKWVCDEEMQKLKDKEQQLTLF